MMSSGIWCVGKHTLRDISENIRYGFIAMCRVRAPKRSALGVLTHLDVPNGSKGVTVAYFATVQVKCVSEKEKYTVRILSC